MQNDHRPRFHRHPRILAIVALTFALIMTTSVVVFAGKSTLGDFVWHDANADGNKDAGEVGINNVVINLYRDGIDPNIPKNGQIDPSELISTTTTAFLSGNDEPLDDNGYYDFDITGGTASDPEIYFVEVAPSNFAPGGALENYVFIGGVATADPNIASTNPWTEFVPLIQMDINTVDFPFALKGIEVVKTAGTAADGATYYIDAAQTVTYTYVVSNKGEVPLDLLAQGYGLVDNVCSPVTYVSGDDGNDLLDVNEQWVYECAQTISLDTTNVITATGNPVDDQGNDLPGNDAVDTDDAVVDLVSPDVSLAKTVYSGHNAGASCPGSESVTVNLNSNITYCFVVTNTGDTYLDTIVISDTTLGIPPALVVGAPGNAFPLAPNGGTATFYYQTTATKELINTADATGTPTDDAGDPLGVDPVTSPPDNAEVKLNPLPGAIGDFVWYDADNDGIQDVGEPGIPNVVLELYDINDTLLLTTTTGTDGGYIFPNLPAGDYYVDVVNATVPTGYTLTVGPQSETDPSGVISLTPGEFYEDADFGYVRPTNGDATIGDTVFFDGNGNGVQDPGEPGISGVDVIATDSNNVTYSATTDENGNYLITVPAGDSYSVAPDPTTLPAITGLAATTPISQTTPVLVANEQYLDADFGYDSPNLGVIGNQVWFDTGTFPGVFDSATEVGIPGVTVDLWVDADNSNSLTALDYIYATVVTDENGQYQFGGVQAGEYLVIVSDTANVLDDYIPTIVVGAGDNFNKAQPYAISLAAGQTNNTADFGYVPDPGSSPDKGIIGNQLWYETGSSVNGIFEPENGDIGLAGITVELLDENDVVIATQTTGSSGLYAFTSLPAGNYTVRVGATGTYPTNAAILAPYLPTVLIGGTADNTNKLATGYAVTLATDEVNTTADFGYTDKNRIGDFIWWDQDGDGIQDPGEPGIPGVTVTLLDSNGDPILGVPPVLTGPNGEYLFENLLPGNYIVTVAPPFNGTPSPERTGNGTNDSAFGNDNQVAETLTLGEQNLDIDGGFIFDTRYEISKVLNTPEPVRVGDPISYTITITNLGTSIITSLPLTDTYDPDFLDYVSAVPAPTSTDEPNGTLFWADLLTGPLGQDESVSIVVEFTGIADTGTDADNNPNNNPTPPVTINVARSEGGTFDPDGPGDIPPTQPLPPVEDDEPVQIINPTSVMVATASVSRGGAVANLRWATANEVKIVGFNLIRLVNGDATQLNEALIVAQFAGQSLSGAYEFQDANPVMGARNVYRLEIHMSDGRVEQHGLGVLHMTTGQIFLPLVTTRQ